MGEIENKEVTEGANVTFECSAEGNPPPQMHWISVPAGNVSVTSGWRQTNMNIREATSTNTGVYICLATNKVGNATRSVKLAMKGIIIDYAEHLCRNNIYSEVVTVAAIHSLQKKTQTFKASRGEKYTLN